MVWWGILAIIVSTIPLLLFLILIIRELLNEYFENTKGGD